MKYTFTVFSILFLFLFGYSQEIPKINAYLSVENYKKDSTITGNDFIIIKRTTKDIRWNGGNDFKVKSNSNKRNKNFIKYKLWGIKSGDTLYLNGWKMGLGMGYIKALTIGRYICFEGWIPLSKHNLNQLKKAGLYNPSGGLIIFQKPAYPNLLRFLYLYDTDKNKVDLLNETTILNLFEQNTSIRNSFLNESKKDKETFIKYIELKNSIQ